MEGSGHLEKFRGPTDKKNGPPKNRKKVENFVKNEAIYFPFWPLVPPKGAVCTEKTWLFSGQKIIGPEKIEFFFRCRFKNVFASKTERFLRFFLLVFGPWCPLLGMRTERTLPFSGPKWATNPEKVEFGGRSGRNTCRPNLIAC